MGVKYYLVIYRSPPPCTTLPQVAPTFTEQLSYRSPPPSLNSSPTVHPTLTAQLSYRSPHPHCTTLLQVTPSSLSLHVSPTVISTLTAQLSYRLPSLHSSPTGHPHCTALIPVTPTLSAQFSYLFLLLREAAVARESVELHHACTENNRSSTRSHQ